MRTLSMRGKPVDFARYYAEEGDAIALGNASLNARGDLIDKSGNVLQTRAEIAAEYHRSNAKSVRHVSIKEVETYANPQEAVATLMAQHKQNTAKRQEAAEAKFSSKGRKLVDDE